jgi:acetylornithine deacetylase/succinyl-diaminopimelate desuccinylase-like protein
MDKELNALLGDLVSIDSVNPEAAVAAVARRSLRGDVILTAVVDEEYASKGTEAVAKRWKADAAIVGEPTGLSIVTAHKGFAWFEIKRAASRPTGMPA